MFAQPRSRRELEEELREQAAALRASASAYDTGALWEAKRLATTAYILLHDGDGKSKSLLKQLGLKGEMLSTADHRPEAPLPLAIITIDMNAGGKGMSFVPRLSEHSNDRRIIPFKKWYKEPIFCHGNLRLNRMNLIFTFRHQAGGAHVDPTITNEPFKWLMRNSPIRIKSEPARTFRDENGNDVEFSAEFPNIIAEYDGPVPNGHYASMRQIAWEIDQRLLDIGV